MLFSGQAALPELVAHVADYSVATLLLLGFCKILMYGISLSAFRGGPIFPAMLIGAVLGMAMGGLPGMDMAPAIAMGIGAMCVAMLDVPLTLDPARGAVARVGRNLRDTAGHHRRGGGIHPDHDSPFPGSHEMENHPAG